MKQNISITITGISISMDLDDVEIDDHDAVEQVKAICCENPELIATAIEDAVNAGENITMCARF